MADTATCIRPDCDHPVTAYYEFNAILGGGWGPRGTRIWMEPMVGADPYCHHHALELGTAFGSSCDPSRADRRPHPDVMGSSAQQRPTG